VLGAASPISVYAGPFLAIIVMTSVVAGTLAVVLGSRSVIVPVVVLELIGGVIIGPKLLGLADSTHFTDFFSDLGLGMLFFFAGYEIDPDRIRGEPLRLAMLGWALSLALAYSVGGALAAAGIVLSLLYTGSALATTAIGTLIPLLSDTGELKTGFGSYLLAAGAIGEFGPIMLLTLILSTQDPLRNAAILVAFVALAVLVAVLAIRSSRRSWPLLERTLEQSSQLAVRWILVLVFALALLASNLGLDLLLGGFAAGLITRLILRVHEAAVFESKLNAIAFGIFIPFYFVVSGSKLDIGALFASGSAVLKLASFLALMLIVRGLPALLLYRRALGARDRLSLAFFSATQLPLVLAITTVAQDTGHMLPTTAAALVGAAVLSTLIFPFVGLRLRGDARLAEPAAELATST
jgi:Kef-type K+ transport system membrane component KefB